MWKKKGWHDKLEHYLRARDSELSYELIENFTAKNSNDGYPPKDLKRTIEGQTIVSSMIHLLQKTPASEISSPGGVTGMLLCP